MLKFVIVKTVMIRTTRGSINSVASTDLKPASVPVG